MKFQHLLPVVAAAIGFSIAWIAKPAPATVKTGQNEPAATTKAPRNSSPRTRPDSVAGQRPTEVKPGDFPLADLAEEGPQTRSEGKMLRLTEALGLTLDQQREIIRIIEESKTKASDAVPVIEDLAVRGRMVEETLSKVLSPEQFAKFQEIRVRERDNRIEAAAQRALSQVINEIDLSPAQRDEALARLRQTEKEKIQTIPSAATLLLKTSVLPTDANELTMDGVLGLSQLSAQAPPENLELAHQQFIQSQKQKLEEKLRCFDGIFTPGQMGQYHAIIAEQKAIIENIPTPKKQSVSPAP
jgi:hypothetical protein